MKEITKTTMKLNNALDALKLKRLNTVSITDKAMTQLAIDNIAVGELKHITFYNVTDEETGEINSQVVFGTERGNFSTCSAVVLSLAYDIYDGVVDNDIVLQDVGLKFGFGNSRNGNKYLSCEIM